MIMMTLENETEREAGQVFDTYADVDDGFMLGLCAAMEQYRKSSNRESGYGRYDIQLTPKLPYLPGIIIELKAAKDCSEDELRELSKKALQQIEEKKYDTELREAGVTDIIKYGVAFCGKKVEIAIE